MNATLAITSARSNAKVCAHCGELKQSEAFNKRSRNSIRLSSWCKTCCSEWSKTHPHPVTITEKLCKHCGYVRSVSEFSIDTAKKDGLRAVCKAHDSKLRKSRWNPKLEAEKALKGRQQNRPKAMLKAVRQGAKKRGILCTLVEADLAAVPIPDRCPVLGIPMFWTPKKRTANTPSIDRLNPNGIYEKNNWRYISWKANRLRSDCSDAETFEALAADIRRLGFGNGPCAADAPPEKQTGNLVRLR
jgi:hypothetical protein